MLYLETAVQCLQANAAAIESEIITFALSIHANLPQVHQLTFAALFARDPAKVVPNSAFGSREARKWLYPLIDELIIESKTPLPWPGDAYDKIADPRNVVIHRTNKLLDDGLIELLEDRDPAALHQEVEDSTECLIRCFAALEALNAVRKSWKQIDVPNVAARVAARAKKS